MALAWPEIHFHLRHNGKTVKRWASVTDPVDRIADVLGKHLRADLHPLELATPAADLHGWMGSPQATRSTTRGIYVYVNGRRIRDRVIQHALLSGFAGRLMKGQFPVAVLFLKVPYDQVDVNVHPAKHEVRFARQKDIHQVVAQAVGSALRSHERRRLQFINDEVRGNEPGWGQMDGQTATGSSSPLVEEPRSPFAANAWRELPPGPASPGRAHSSPLFDHQPADREEATKTATAPPRQSDLWERRPFADLTIIGQLHQTYILCESEGGLILIDQHAAHERVLYEQLLAQQESRKPPPAQKLLLPETIELSFEEAALMTQLLPQLKDLGLDMEPFGGTTFVIKAVPTFLDGREAAPLVHEIVEKMAAVDVEPDAEALIDPCLKLMACHGSIRAHQRLTEPEMRQLLSQMDACRNPSNCPHGRPTWIKWGQRALERAFNRIV